MNKGGHTRLRNNCFMPLCCDLLHGLRYSGTWDDVGTAARRMDRGMWRGKSLEAFLSTLPLSDCYWPLVVYIERISSFKTNTMFEG